MSSSQEPQPLDRLSTLDFNKIKAELDSSGKIECPTPTCNETFKSIWGLKFHLKKNTCNSPKFKCEKCAGAFQSRILLQQHICDVSEEGTTDKGILKAANAEESFVQQGILTPGAKGDHVSQINTNVKTKSSESLASNLEMLSQKKKQESSPKQKDELQLISKDNPTDISSNSGEDSVVKDELQNYEEVVVGREEICTTSVEPIQTTKQIENSSDVQDVANMKRKRGRPRKSENVTAKTPRGKEVPPEPRKDQSTEEIFTSPKRKRGRPRKTESPGDKTSDSSELSKVPSVVDSAQQEDMNGNSVTNDQKETSLPTLDFATPKKRGRPPKAKKTRGRPRKIMTDSPSNVEVSKRSSVRSASKKG